MELLLLLAWLVLGNSFDKPLVKKLVCLYPVEDRFGEQYNRQTYKRQILKVSFGQINKKQEGKTVCRQKMTL